MTDLKETVALMCSDNYKDRMKAEYWQARIRYERLRRIVIKLDAGTLDFKNASPCGALREQADMLRHYVDLLEMRAELEGVSLFDE